MEDDENKSMTRTSTAKNNNRSRASNSAVACSLFAVFRFSSQPSFRRHFFPAPSYLHIISLLLLLLLFCVCYSFRFIFTLPCTSRSFKMSRVDAAHRALF